MRHKLDFLSDINTLIKSNKDLKRVNLSNLKYRYYLDKNDQLYVVTKSNIKALQPYKSTDGIAYIVKFKNNTQKLTSIKELRSGYIFYKKGTIQARYLNIILDKDRPVYTLAIMFQKTRSYINKIRSGYYYVKDDMIFTANKKLSKGVNDVN